jgi:hypothetical protein
MEDDDSVERAIVRFPLTRNPEEIETLADDLGAMDRRGNLNYAFVDPSRLDAQSSDAVRRLNSAIPRRFFPAS